MSRNAELLITDGLNGKLVDIEGEFPFHLNLIYKKKQRKWYVENNGKEYYIKGGQTALAKIRTAILGTAMPTSNKYKSGYNLNRTLLVKDRLAILVGEENAIEIVINVKRMGALMNVIGVSNN